ncbi:PAS domain-containing sensor histidine kinase [Pantanalinema sp. GBBB05]|uniref:PAS domain-containing sensor histidine kinase n=1 Tax=Pantanalinema sp. GBBB05 TaxID=2604139 RepID=UPI001DF1E2B5|nr:PAS domain S-box protein [Pantanalinema sp. GBBB05]
MLELLTGRRPTERLLTPQTLMAQAQTQLLDLVHDSILAFDIEGTITFWNRAAEELYGWTKAEALGQHIYTLLKTELPQPLADSKVQILQQGRWEKELIRTRRDGTQVCVTSRRTLQRDGQGNPVAILEITHDVTDLRQLEGALQQAHQNLQFCQIQQTQTLEAENAALKAELLKRERVEAELRQRLEDQTAIALCTAQSYEQLEQLIDSRTQELEQARQQAETANHAKSEFLATMSHELRTPLNAVLGLSQVLQQEIFGALNPKQAEYIGHIRSSGEHLLLLINDILDLAKVEAGRETLELGPVVVNELCHSCLSLIQEQAFQKGLEILSQIDPAIDTCIADERRLRQMLLNLLSNAIKFTPTGNITLLVQAQTEGITFTVADTGIGIGTEQLSLLFQPFQQLDCQLNRQYIGTGLGLALTRNLARLHGGDVTVESSLGEGSRFTIYLPDLAQD